MLDDIISTIEALYGSVCNVTAALSISYQSTLINDSEAEEIACRRHKQEPAHD